ncbi:hypothetical protein CONLIGDRAFT_85105 [Coniochaeta ligniaria NRRL 30616]|uniref:Pre-rRNA-processing protein TSR2 n=1 Tax=Coniochaeta ligniaria NRRL 30616 TaxID=1408157 RepID=A0A1J7ICP8_9PEZI|nr:hypothetical protein CONLIGDRAFT_85105 [Coniochaeta ligniaria NRRL 30616]
MASSSKQDAPSPATCQSQFEQGVAYALHLWPDLTLAVQNNWGGADSADKRDWFAGAVVELFPDLSKPSTTTTSTTTSTAEQTADDGEPDSAYVEEFLLQVMLDEFEVNVDDDSGFEVAESILRVRGECLRGKFDEVESDEEEDENDVEMGDAPPPAPKEKVEPEVDEDGFTKVTKKKR